MTDKLTAAADVVLLVDDDREVRDALAQTLQLAGIRVQVAASFVEAKDHITPDFAGIVVSDIRMPGRDGFHLLDQVRHADPDLPVILLTGHADVPMAVRSIAAGAFAFLEKPCAPRDFTASVKEALALRSATMEARARARTVKIGDAASRMLFGASGLADALREAVRGAARARGEVLISGEAGTGTPKVAEVLHLLSPNAAAPFIKRGCAALPPEAMADAIDEAKGGTLYLDEVGALPGAAQFALLDALDTGIAARVVAGTTRALDNEVAQGRFGSDLYWRLNVISVRIPSLRERPSDIPILFRHYVALASEQANVSPPEIAPDMAARLMAQDWPGNARALMNAAMKFTLGLTPVALDGVGHGLPGGAALGLTQRMAEVERSLLVDALRRTGGQATDAARLLKLPRKTFYDKLARHDIRAEAYRGES